MACHRQSFGLWPMRPAGLEPATCGLGNRRHKDVTITQAKTCQGAQQQLTPQLTPKSQKQPKIGPSELPPDLAKIVAVWPELPKHIKAAIKALVQTKLDKGGTL